MLLPVLGLLALWNIFVFILYWADKRRAAKGKWRISEKALLLCTMLLGSVGAWLAVFQLRHKSQHWKFRVVTWLSLILQILIFIAVLGILYLERSI